MSSGANGTVVRVEGSSVFVQCHNVAVEDEMGIEELVSTGGFQQIVLCLYYAPFGRSERINHDDDIG